MATETATEQVPQTPTYEEQLSPHQRQQLKAFKEIVFNGIRWAGWRLGRDGNDMAGLAIVYALEKDKPLGFNHKVSVAHVANEEDHRAALMEGVVKMVEDFVAANIGAPTIDVLSANDDPIWDQSPVTGYGRVVDALATPDLQAPDAEVVEETVPQALATINREAVEAEVMAREFGVPKPTWIDVVKDRLMRRM